MDLGFLEELSAAAAYKRMKKIQQPKDLLISKRIKMKSKQLQKKKLKNLNQNATQIKDRKPILEKNLSNGHEENASIKSSKIVVNSKESSTKTSKNTSVYNNKLTSTKLNKDLSKIKKKKSEIKSLTVSSSSTSEISLDNRETNSAATIDFSANVPTNNSIQEGQKIFKRILSPMNENTFFNEFWEKSPCYIQKKNSIFFTNLMSFSMIDRMLRQHHIEYTKNLDVTSYKNGVRETLNPEGRATPPDVWSFYNEGCSIRLLNPQTFLPAVYTMNASLQEYFHCMVGANVYLTPPNSQGFAPHYDDIEAFVLQVEGKKRWKLYAPRSINEQLPRYSSPNFNLNEIGEPIFDKVIEPGDVLYFPRGIIHQACTEPGYHSLHITLSVYQKTSYADLFEHLLPMALSNAIKRHLHLREGLPLNIWRTFGKIYSLTETTCTDKNKERKEVVKKCKDIFKEILNHLEFDDAVDQLAKKFQHDALPPVLTQEESVRTIFGNTTILNKQGIAIIPLQISLDTKIRLIRGNICRLVFEENVYRMYFYIDNSREYHEYDANFFEVEASSLPVIQGIIKCYPNYISVKDLPNNNTEIDEKLSIVQLLWDRGLLMTENPII